MAERGGSGQSGRSRVLLGVLIGVAVGVGVTTAVQSAPVAGQTARVATVPAGLSQDLTELNVKLVRAIKLLPVGRGTSTPAVDAGRWLRRLSDLEAIKLRAVARFPDVLGVPFSETFAGLSCVDENIAVGKRLLALLARGNLQFGPSGVGVNVYVVQSLHSLLTSAKVCKDTLESALRKATGPAPEPKVSLGILPSFDLTPAQQAQLTVAATTSAGTNTTDASQLNADATLKAAYTTDGFVGAHERDYVTTGVATASQPDTWPSGESVLYFVGFDLFKTPSGAASAAETSGLDLLANNLTVLTGSSLGLGEKVFQTAPSSSGLLNTIIVVQRGSVVMKIASACRGCTPGTVPADAAAFAKAQIAQAEAHGLPK